MLLSAQPPDNDDWVKVCSHIYYRYSAVCNPYKYRERNMESMNSSFAKVLFFIISASVAINIPRFFETSIVTMGHPNNTSVFPDLEGFSYTFEVSPLRTDPDYIRYFFISNQAQAMPVSKSSRAKSIIWAIETIEPSKCWATPIRMLYFTLVQSEAHIILAQETLIQRLARAMLFT